MSKAKVLAALITIGLLAAGCSAASGATGASGSSGATGTSIAQACAAVGTTVSFIYSEGATSAQANNATNVINDYGSPLAGELQNIYNVQGTGNRHISAILPYIGQMEDYCQAHGYSGLGS